MSLARAVAELREDMVPLYWDPDAGERGLWVMATDRDTAHRYGEWVAKRELTYAKRTYRAMRAADVDPGRLRLWRDAITSLAKAEGLGALELRALRRELDAPPGPLRALYDLVVAAKA